MKISHFRPDIVAQELLLSAGINGENLSDSMRLLERSSIPICTSCRIFSLALFLYWRGLAADPPVIPQPAPPNPSMQSAIHLHEPYILAHDKKYFLFGTTSPAEGIQCYESQDLVRWKLDGWAWRKSGLHVARGDLHSPQVFQYQGMFCLVYSGRMPTGAQLGLAAGTKAEGPYHDLHVPWLTLGAGCIAGDVFVDRGGKAYLTYTKANTRDGCNTRVIYGVALNRDLSKIVGEPIKLLEPTQRWELVQRNCNQINEGSRIGRLGSKYCLFYCANDALSAEYGIGYAVADKPLGPWSKDPANPLFRTQPEMGAFGPGHPALFRAFDRSEWFVVYDSLLDPNRPGDYVVKIAPISEAGSKLVVSGRTRTLQAVPAPLR